MPGRPERLRAARGAQPHRQLGLHGSGPDADLRVVALTAGHVDAFPAPQRPHGLDALQHDLLAFGVVVRRKDEVVAMPAGRDRHPHAAVGQIVHNGPFLGHAQRVVQRQHHTARADRDPVGHHGQCRRRDRGRRIEPAELVEVPFWCPDRAEPVAVGVLRAFQQEPVTLAAGCARVVAREVEQAEVELPRGPRGAQHGVRVRLGDHDGEAPGQRPQQLDHGDVERDAADRQPHAGLIGSDPAIQLGVQGDHLAVVDHHALGLPGRARGVADVRQHLRRHRDLGRGGRFAVHVRHVDQRDAVLRHRGPAVRVDEDRRRCRVLEDEPETSGRVLRIQWHIRRTGLEHTEQGGDGVRRPPHRDPDQAARPGPGGDQPVRDLVRPALKLRVRQRDFHAHHGGRVRGAFGLGVEGLVDGLQGDRRLGVVPVHGQPHTFRQRQEVQFGQTGVRARDRGLQELPGVLQEALHPVAVEQLGRVLQAQLDTSGGPLGDAEGEVEARGAGVQRDALDFHVPHPRRLELLVDLQQRHLEQRVGARVPVRPQLVDQLVERHVLVRVRGVDGVLGPCQQFPEVRVTRGGHPQHDRVGEVADQLLQLRPGAAGERRSGNDVVLPGVPARHRGQCGQRQGKHPGRFGAAQGLELTVQPGGQNVLHGVARPARSGRSRPVGRKPQRLQACQGLSPVLHRRLAQRGGLSAVLPCGVVGVLDRQIRQHGGPALASGAVELDQFPGEDLGGPGVGGDVVQGEDEQVLVARQPHEVRPQQRVALQVEPAASGRGQQGGGPAFTVLELPQIRHGEQVRGRWADDLTRAAGRVDVARAQALVPRDQSGDRLPQQGHVELTAQAHGHRGVVDGLSVSPLVHEPQPLLRERQRQRLVPAHYGYPAGLAFGRTPGPEFGHECRTLLGCQLAQPLLSALVHRAPRSSVATLR